MARQNINLGSDPNDGEGDNLRTAFDKVNDNFIEVYTAGPVGSNIVISGNVISSNVTNANIELSPNGVGKVVVKNDLRPDQNNLRYLGDANLRFRGAYIGTAGINTTGDIITTGNISANNIQYTGEVFVGDLKGSVFADDSTVIVDAIDNVVSADSGIFSNIRAGNILPSANVTYNLGSPTRQWNELYVSGNTIYLNNVPLSISGNTLSVNGEPILSNDSTTNIITTGNITATRFVGDGSALTGITSSYGNSNVATYLPTYTGNLSPGNILTDNYFFANGAPFSSGANTGDITFSATTISAADDTSITIQALDGNSNLRSRIRLTPDVGAVSMRGYSSEDSTSFTDSAWSTANWIASGGGGSLVLVGAATVNDFINNDLNYATNIKFNINGGTPESLESYGYSSGTQTLSINTASAPETDPTAVTEVEFFYTFSSSVGVDYDDGAITMSARGDMNIRLESDLDISLVAGDDVRIEGADSFRLINNSTTAPIRIITDDNNNSYTWAFNADGTLTVPGNITTTGNVSAANFLGNIAAADVVGTVSSATTAGTVTTAAQPNITSVGTLSSLSVTGNITGGNLLFAVGNLVLASDNGLIVKNNSTGNIALFQENQSVLGTDGTSTYDIRTINKSSGAVPNVTVRAGSASGTAIRSGDATLQGGQSSVASLQGGNAVVVGGRATEVGATGGNVVVRGGSSTESTPGIVFIGDANTADVRIGSASSNANVQGNILASGYATITGNITGGNLIATGNIDATVNGFDIGYLEIPQIALGANVTANLTNSGKHFYSTTAGDLTLTIPSNANVAFPTGTAFTIVVQAAGNVIVAEQNGDVDLYLAGNATSGNRTVGTYGMATVVKVATNTWFINGTGVS